jgi:prepilin-type processing-associated H-X9-DG protein
MKFTILGQGMAVPNFSISQEEAAEYALAYNCTTEKQRKVLPGLYRMTGVKRRNSVLLTAKEGQESRQYFLPAPKSPSDPGPTISARMMLYEQKAPPLAIEASRMALEKSGLSTDEITHIITVSCSGFAAPGVDVTLIRELGLSNTVQRVHVGFMGCHGALNGLRTARALAESDPDARILICAVELCSLHYHYGWDTERVVANALFADGSAAIVGRASNGELPDAWRISATGSCLVPDSEDAMTWSIRDNGFVMSLSPKVPGLIGTHLREWMEGWLGEKGFTLDDIKSWAVHPGGPRILSSVGQALDLDKEALNASKEILRDYGNMSSPTILFILNHLREQGAERPCVALAFGPGLMAEATLFT